LTAGTFLEKEVAMADFPKKGFSSADPDDEIDLEALVQKMPPPQPQQKSEPEEEFDLGSVPKAPQKPAVEAPKQPAVKPVETRKQPADEFDIESLKPVQKKIDKPILQKSQPPVQAINKIKDEPAESYNVDAETEFDHLVTRKKVRILPEFPTLVLIIIVSIVTAVITGLIVRFSVPSLQSKVQEVLSNEENTSVKVNDLEQSVSKLIDDVKALQEKAKAQPAAPAPAPVKKHKAKPKAEEPQPESESPAPGPATEGAGTE
jgi:outer membrane murein-binding lipoprotein Lpp